MESETIVYRGIKWRRYPESKRRNDRLYYKPAPNFFQNGWEQYLHRQIWRDTNGPIPEGMHIHHSDGNQLNNELSNLECLTSKQHSRHHADTATEEQREASRRLMERLRPLAAKWHGSAEGKAWHSAMGAASWVGREPTEHVCENCGKTYQTLAAHGHTRFCSGVCKTAWRLHSGIDDEQRVCVGCGGTYTVNKFYAQSFCSRSCAAKHRKPRGPNKKR